MNIKDLKKEYEKQDNRATAYPIYVTVQELVCIGVMDENYSVICPYGDGENKVKYTHPDLEEEYDTFYEAREALKEDCGEDEGIQRTNLGYIWVPVEFFLTIKGAEEYIKYNQHNHNKLRTYVNHFNRRNYEMHEFLKESGFKTEDGADH